MAKKKAQAAMEYLVTYGWAILAILVVGVVLWQFGAFTPPTPPPGCSGFSEIKPLGWSAQKSQEKFILVITNEAGLKLNITQIDIYISDANCGGDSTDLQLRPGESRKYEISCDQLSDQYAQNEYYRANINVSYTNPQSTIDHKSTGECWGVIE